MFCWISMTGISSSVSSLYPLPVVFPLQGTFVSCPPFAQFSQLYYPVHRAFCKTWPAPSSYWESWLRRIMIMRWEYRYHFALSDCMVTTSAKSWYWAQLSVFAEQAQWWLTEWDRCQPQILWTKTMIMLQWAAILIAAKCVFSEPSFCSVLASNS